MIEAWKDIVGLEGFYQISNFGNVRSLDRYINTRYGKSFERGIDMKICNDTKGYKIIRLSDASGIRRTYKVHHLVWDHFGDSPRNGQKLQVDHVDEDKSNNRIDNFQLLTNRDNVSKTNAKRPKSSKYIGVSWHKQNLYWTARITDGEKYKHLGVFENEVEASEAYLREKERIINREVLTQEKTL